MKAIEQEELAIRYEIEEGGADTEYRGKRSATDHGDATIAQNDREFKENVDYKSVIKPDAKAPVEPDLVLPPHSNVPLGDFGRYKSFGSSSGMRSGLHPEYDPKIPGEEGMTTILKFNSWTKHMCDREM